MTKTTYHHGDLKNSLIEAGIEILANEGVGGLSLRKVARKAPFRLTIDQAFPDVIAACAVRDAPRFAWRGVMLDVARHFFTVEEVERLGDNQSCFLLEQFIEGDLYHVDSLVHRGQVIFAEVNGYVRPLLDVYHGGGIYATRTVARHHPLVDRLRHANEKVLTGFGLPWGASHTEFLVGRNDGEIYLVETSARVGGANTAEMVEAATGINLWSEWAAIELLGDSYRLPPTKQLYGGTIVSLTRQEWPDSSSFNDPEIVYRLQMKQHIGLVVASPLLERIEQLLGDYSQRIARDYLMVLPPADKVSH